MAYTRITALWSGATGLPGYTRLKFLGDLNASEAAAAAGRMRAWFNAIGPYLPAGVIISFTDVAQHFDNRHQLTGEVTYTPPASVTGSGSGTYAAPVGYVVNWITNSFQGGRKIRGRSFLVPIVGAAFSTDGSPAGAALTVVIAASQTLVAGTPPMVIAGGNDEGTRYFASVSGATVPDRAAVLRSRRD